MVHIVSYSLLLMMALTQLKREDSVWWPAAVWAGQGVGGVGDTRSVTCTMPR